MTVILDRRSDRRLSAIIPSNLDLDAVALFYEDKRVPSRIVEMAYETIEVGGTDRRLAPKRAGRPGALRVVGREE